jgi:hypothetical protein
MFLFLGDPTLDAVQNVVGPAHQKIEQEIDIVKIVCPKGNGFGFSDSCVR